MNEVLSSVAETIKNFAVIYLVDITEVPDFNTMYELMTLQRLCSSSWNWKQQQQDQLGYEGQAGVH
ncbi:thioredoxin-like 4A [Trifolium pratense]|uniref:Thioredoxin-like 4A n=1 Tax=Trifolium pratense TaxID=57577 RepID=A0A2K3L9U5_TRIPR|nr:thioredoxin-like 4A [Trifolium pratense]